MSADGGLVVHAGPDDLTTVLHVQRTALARGGAVWRYLVTDVCGICGFRIPLDDEHLYTPVRIGGDSANGYEPICNAHEDEEDEPEDFLVVAVEPFASPNDTNQQVAEWMSDRDAVISDGAARTIASWWQSSGTIGSHLAGLASGHTVWATAVETDSLLTVNEHPDMHGRDKEALWALTAWVRQPAHTDRFTSEQEEQA